MELTEVQKMALPILEWLFDPRIKVGGVGRTTLMAHYFIQRAIKTGEPVRPFDHHHPYEYSHNAHSIFPVIKQMATSDDYKEYDFIWYMSSGSFTMKRK